MTTLTLIEPRLIFAEFTDAKTMCGVLQPVAAKLCNAPVQVLRCDVAHAWQKIYVKPASGKKSYLEICYRLRLKNLQSDIEFVIWIHSTVHPATADLNAHYDSNTVVRCDRPGGTALLRRFPDDIALAQLPQLIEPNGAMASLMRALGTSSCDAKVLGSEVIHFRPGTRCSIRYDLHAGVTGLPDRVFAKTYNDALGERVHARQQALWAQREETLLHVAQPLGYDATTRTVWQHYVEGISAARACVLTNGTVHVVSAVAQTIAALHKSTVTAVNTTHREALMQDTFKRVAKLSVAYPALAHVLQNAFDRADDALPSLPRAAPVTIHGDAHLEQFLIRGATAIVVDWDELSLGDREQDLAALMVDLRLRAALGIAPLHSHTELLGAYARSSALPVSENLLMWHLCMQCMNKCYRLHWRVSGSLEDQIVLAARWAEEYARAIENAQVLSC